MYPCLTARLSLVDLTDRAGRDVLRLAFMISLCSGSRQQIVIIALNVERLAFHDQRITDVWDSCCSVIADWKDSFFPDQTIPAEHAPMESVGNGIYTSEIRSLQLLRQTMGYDIAQVQHFIDTDDVLGISQTFETLRRDLLNWIDRDIQSLLEKNQDDQ